MFDGKIQRSIPYPVGLLDDNGDAFGANFYIDAAGKKHSIFAFNDTINASIVDVSDSNDFVFLDGFGEQEPAAPFAYVGGKFVDLPQALQNARLDTYSEDVRAINGSGEIVGPGYIYRNGIAGPFTAVGSPRDLNNLGQIVGSNYLQDNPNGLTDAMFYVNGRAIDLNDAIPYGSGFYLNDAVMINDAGDILVQATAANGTDWLLLQPQRASISGSVFNDTNHDGVREASETPLKGIRVYVDLNHNGHYDAGEPTAITDAAGNYTISVLHGGTYVVRQVTPSVWFQTTPTGGAGMTISLEAGDHRTLAPFGQAPLTPGR